MALAGRRKGESEPHIFRSVVCGARVRPSSRGKNGEMKTAYNALSRTWHRAATGGKCGEVCGRQVTCTGRVAGCISEKWDVHWGKTAQPIFDDLAVRAQQACWALAKIPEKQMGPCRNRGKRAFALC
jgi:hypothetical protein